MHTEDIRARRAARHFRRLINASSFAAQSADVLLAAAGIVTGVRRATLPAGDPLLCGAHALLDRNFNTIWINRERSLSDQHADAAHEYGHLILHSESAEASEDHFEQTYAGYSRNQRDEVDAHRFAAEFLLPLTVAKQRFFAGLSARRIANDQLIPHRLVVRQLAAAFEHSDDVLEEASSVGVHLDSWQRDAVTTPHPAIVCGRPGTGKTIALVARTRFLIEVKGAEPSSILVIAPSKNAASELRRALLLGFNAKQGLVPVATAHQIAYDVLVRFPEEAKLEAGWEERADVSGGRTADQLLDAATAMVRDHPAVSANFRSRYLHYLADDFDRISSEARAFLGLLIPPGGPGFWGTSSLPHLALSYRSDDPPSADAFAVSIARPFRFAFQYSAAPTILRLRQAMELAGERKEVSRRRTDRRCGDGGVTIAIASDRGQMIEGIAQYIKHKLDNAYGPSDILALYRLSVTSDALWLSRLSHKLKIELPRQVLSRHALDLSAVLELCAGNWTIDSVIRAGRAGLYSAPLAELIKLSQLPANERDDLPEEVGPGVRALLADIDRCRNAPSQVETLLTYLFESSNYLRVEPDAGPSAADLIRVLKAAASADSAGNGHGVDLDLFKSRSQKDVAGIQLANANTQSGRRRPIVIQADADVERLHNLIAGKVDKSTFGGTAPERNAVHFAEDYVLYCAFSTSPNRLFTVARQIAKALPEVNVVDWTELPATGASVRDKNIVFRSSNDAETDLYRQCPRRVYYSRLLSADSTAAEESPVASSEFPAAPADAALCERCCFSRICPVDLQ